MTLIWFKNGAYILQLICFARVYLNVSAINNKNQSVTATLLKQGHQYHALGKAFSKLYRGHPELIVKYNAGLETFLQQCVSEPVLLMNF